MFERGEALNPVGYKIGLELIVKCGCTRIAELPIQFSDRRFGQSKLGLREQINYLRHLKRLADFKFGGWSQLGQFYLIGASGMAVGSAESTRLLLRGESRTAHGTGACHLHRHVLELRPQSARVVFGQSLW